MKAICRLVANADGRYGLGEHALAKSIKWFMQIPRMAVRKVQWYGEIIGKAEAEAKAYKASPDDVEYELSSRYGSLKITFRKTRAESVIYDIFERGVYDFQLGCKCVVWDIGMNVGAASLFFAQMPEVEAVLGYEPVTPTYDAALKNLAANLDAAKKIKTFNTGISAQAGTAEVEYHEDVSGSASLHGYVFRIPGLKMRMEPITLLAANDVLAQIRSDYPDMQIVIKVDCEGSEYDIIPALASSPDLEAVSVIMVEYHRQGPEKLLDALRGKGFTFIIRPDKDDEVGMVYAVRA